MNGTFNRMSELVSLGQQPEPVISFEEWRTLQRTKASNTGSTCLLSTVVDEQTALQAPLTPDVVDHQTSAGWDNNQVGSIADFRREVTEAQPPPGTPPPPYTYS